MRADLIQGYDEDDKANYVFTRLTNGVPTAVAIISKAAVATIVLDEDSEAAAESRTTQHCKENPT